MKTYIYKIENYSNKRGYNRTVTVFKMRYNKPLLIGFNNEIQSAAWAGASETAQRIIEKETTNKHYHLWEV